MNWNKVEENWSDMTDDELDVIGGKHDQLDGKIQAKYEIKKEEAEKQVENFSCTYHSDGK